MTLTEASKTAKKGMVLLGIVAIIYYIFLLLFFPGAKALFNALFPEKNPPNPIFGMLPPLEFVEKNTKGEFEPSFKLDTIDGKLPREIPKKLTVYEVKKKVPSFEKGKNAIDTAGELGYNDDDLITSLKEPVYKWRKLASNGLLEIDTNNRHLTLETSLNGKAGFFPRGTITKGRSVEYAKDILKKVGRFSDKLYEEGTQTVVLGQFAGITMKETNSESDAQIARVDFYRSIDEVPLLGPDPQIGMVYLFLRKPQREDLHYNVPIMGSYISEIVPNSEATYPLINVADAWNFVKQNKGVVVSILPYSSNNLVTYAPVLVEKVFINRIFLAYYDNISSQPYLQPVYVFEGKYTTAGTQGGTIAFYYPAVSPEHIKVN